MRAGNTNEAVQMLNLLLEFFENGARWTRGLYQDGHGRRCLIGALDYLRREHRVPSDTAVYFLQEALPHRTSMIAAAAASPSCARSFSRPAPSRLAKQKETGLPRQ